MRAQAIYRATAVFLVYFFPALVGTAAMLLFSLDRSTKAVHEVCHYVCGKAAGPWRETTRLPESASPLEKRLDQILDAGNRLTPLRSLAHDCCTDCRPPPRPPVAACPTRDAGVAPTGSPAEHPAYDAAPAVADSAPAKPEMPAKTGERRTGKKWPQEASWLRPPKGWIPNAIFILCLTLFPFATFGSRMAANAFDSPKAAKEMFGCASQVFLNKLIVSAAIACGWVFIFHPLGIAASAVDTFLSDHEILAANSLPHLLQSSFSLRPMLAAFFGWYLHFTAYSFYRARRDDVRSPRYLGVLFRKLLLALALGSLLAIGSHGASAIDLPTVGTPDAPSFGASAVAFLFGFLPASAIAFLKDRSAKVGGATLPASGALSDLSALSTWEVVRLEEEGVDSLASLLMTRRQYLRDCLPISSEVVDLWYDEAALMVVVGAERYARLGSVCQTASHFVANSADPAFQAKLKAAADIDNPAEVALILREKFGEDTPAQLRLAPSGNP